VIALALLLVGSCVRPECTPVDYTRAECRVQAANQVAMLRTADGAEVRFQSPGSTGSSSWVATGVLRLDDQGRLNARVAGLGAFRISVHRNQSGAATLDLTVHNVHPAVAPLVGEVERVGLSRVLQLPLDRDVVEITGELPDGFCDRGFSLVSLGDVQTNPLQLQRIVDRLHDEAAYADSLDRPLAGLILLGDLAEFGTREELVEIDRILRSAPVPTATVPGNHDVYASEVAVYNETYGPGNHAFDVCSARIALFDSGGGDMAPSIQGRLPEFLDSEAGFLLSGSHHPPFAAQATMGWTREDQAQLLMSELAARGADLMLAGHAHRRIEHRSAPVRQLVIGTGGATQYAVDPDYGYLRLRFADDLEACFVSVAAPGSVNPIKEGEPITCSDPPPAL